MYPLLFLAPIGVFVALYGVIRRERLYFLLGYLIYGVVVCGNEVRAFVETEENLRLSYALLWGVQSILAFPNQLNYDGSKAFKTFGYKIFLTFSVINVLGVYISNDIPHVEPFIGKIAQVYHGVLAVLPIAGIYLISIDKIPVKNVP